MGFPGGASGKESTYNAGDPGSIPGSRRSPGGTHVHPWVIRVKVWQKPPQYCKVISLQLNQIKKKKIPGGGNVLVFLSGIEEPLQCSCLE